MRFMDLPSLRSLRSSIYTPGWYQESLAWPSNLSLTSCRTRTRVLSLAIRGDKVVVDDEDKSFAADGCHTKTNHIVFKQSDRAETRNMRDQRGDDCST